MNTSEQSEEKPSADNRSVPMFISEEADREYLTILELSSRTGLSISTLRRLQNRKLIPFYQPGGPGSRVLFPRDAIEISSSANASSPNPIPPSEAVRPPTVPRHGPKPHWMDGTK